MTLKNSCWVVLAVFASVMSGCDSTNSMFGEIGTGNDMTRAQELSRENRGLPKATEMPPGLGEDLPMTAEVPATMPANGMVKSSP